MSRSSVAHAEPEPGDLRLTRAEFLAALRVGLLRRVGATQDGKVVQYELTTAGRVLLGRALEEDPCAE